MVLNAATQSAPGRRYVGENGGMRVYIRAEVPCSADAAWEALHSPGAATELYGSFMRMDAPGGFPRRFQSGDEVLVRLLFAGRFTVGRQLIRITDHETQGTLNQERMMRDSGGPVTGPLRVLRGWQHEVTITADPRDEGHAIWRDQLKFTGPFALAFWPVLAVMWWWRKLRIVQLAKRW